jgi:hypothetical protein
MSATNTISEREAAEADCPALARIRAAYKTHGYRRFSIGELIDICSDGPLGSATVDAVAADMVRA